MQSQFIAEQILTKFCKKIDEDLGSNIGYITYLRISSPKKLEWNCMFVRKDCMFIILLNCYYTREQKYAFKLVFYIALKQLYKSKIFVSFLFSLQFGVKKQTP